MPGVLRNQINSTGKRGFESGAAAGLGIAVCAGVRAATRPLPANSRLGLAHSVLFTIPVVGDRHAGRPAFLAC